VKTGWSPKLTESCKEGYVTKMAVLLMMMMMMINNSVNLRIYEESTEGGFPWE
jgi:hypothetical protein